MGDLGLCEQFQLLLLESNRVRLLLSGAVQLLLKLVRRTNFHKAATRKNRRLLFSRLRLTILLSAQLALNNHNETSDQLCALERTSSCAGSPLSCSGSMCNALLGFHLLLRHGEVR